MFTDAKLIFDEAVAVTTSKLGGTAIDLGAITDLGKGQPVFLNVFVDTAFTSAANGLTVSLVASSGAEPAGTDTVLQLSPAILASALTKGVVIFSGPIPDYITNEYINVYYLATTALAAGKVTSFLSLSPVPAP